MCNRHLRSDEARSLQSVALVWAEPGYGPRTIALPDRRNGLQHSDVSVGISYIGPPRPYCMRDHLRKCSSVTAQAGLSQVDHH
ncbi:hypothetical protein KIN20_033139 [Parelaphostrongylus tenuis]|uniref:Uncharacterized protein n=1 Tax=Parelaphostrongylus tenuis TaxID=148309 RepID=A0AAD5WIZ9_PARTN|nr:hypothetical protein KIN20_033139 [Parelaphostrongylus tenuis]